MHQLRWARLVFIIYNAIIVCIVSSDMLQTISFRCVKVKNSDENCKHMSECDYNFRGVFVCVCVCFMNDVCSFYSLCIDNYLKYEKYMYSFKTIFRLDKVNLGCWVSSRPSVRVFIVQASSLYTLIMRLIAIFHDYKIQKMWCTCSMRDVQWAKSNSSQTISGLANLNWFNGSFFSSFSH